MGRIKRSDKLQTQAIISNLFCFFLVITIISSSFGSGVFFHHYTLIHIIGIVLFMICKIDKPFFRYAQSWLFLVEGYMALYFDNGVGNIDGYGLIFLGISLLLYYGYFKIHALSRLLFVSLSFILCFMLSSYKANNINLLLNAVIYVPCIIILELFIWRGLLFDINSEKKNLSELANTLAAREAELNEKEANLKEQESTATIRVDEIKKQIAVEKEELFADKNMLKMSLYKALSYVDLKEEEMRVLSEFYFNRGGLTNAEIAYHLDMKEQSIKNIMSRIYKKMDVRARAELLSKIDKEILNS